MPEGAHCSSASRVAALTSRSGRYSCIGGTRREKGIVVSVPPAGPPSGADHQFRPGSSGAQHAHKRMRTSLAQRAPMMARITSAKRYLCKANEGMTCTCTRNLHRCTAPSQTHLSVSLAASALTSAVMPASPMELPSR